MSGGKNRSLPKISGGLLDIFRPPQVAPVILVRAERREFLALSRQPNVCIDDRERAFLGHLLEDVRRNNMNARKSQRPHPGLSRVPQVSRGPREQVFVRGV